MSNTINYREGFTYKIIEQIGDLYNDKHEVARHFGIVVAPTLLLRGAFMDSIIVKRIDLANLIEILVSIIILLMAITLAQNEYQLKNTQPSSVMETENIPMTWYGDGFDGGIIFRL